jgi:hypothetical protein
VRAKLAHPTRLTSGTWGGLNLLSGPTDIGPSEEPGVLDIHRSVRAECRALRGAGNPAGYQQYTQLSMWVYCLGQLVGLMHRALATIVGLTESDI